jgi:gliding-associated putative ABC transporter substrate-binding component GldG
MANESTRLKVGVNSILFTVLLVVSLLLINVFGAYASCQLDVTEDKLFTLSDASKKIVKEAKSDLKVRVFISRKLVAGLEEVRQYLVDTLDRYKDASRGKFKWELIHPEDSKAKEKLAKEYGIRKATYQTKQTGSKESRELYFGLAITYKRPGADKEEMEIIPTLGWNIQKNLEYLLTERFSRLVRGRKKVVVVTGHNEVPPKAMGQLIKMLAQFFKAYEIVQYNIRGSKPPPADTQVMIVLSPKTPWNEADRKKLNSFVMQGKGVLFMVEGMALQKQRQQFQSQRMPPIMMAHNHGLNDLLWTWGVKIAGNFVMDVGQKPLLIRRGRQAQVIFHPALLNIRYSRRLKAPVTPFLASSLDLKAAYVSNKIQPGKRFRVSPILITSPKAWTVKGPYMFNPQRRDRPPDGARRARYVVGALVEGTLPSGVKGAKPTESKSKARLVVIGDFDLLKLSGAVPGNRILLQNLVDWLAQDEILVKLRNKQIQERELNLPSSKAKRYLIQLANIIGLPILLVLFGIFWWKIRVSRRRGAQRELGKRR